MQIYKINENKLKILITEYDLKKVNISPQDFMACKIQNESFFLSIIKIAKQNLNFYFNNREIIIESFSVPGLKTFIINITTMLKKIKRINTNKSIKFKMFCYFIAKFHSFYDLCAFCNAIKLNSAASLYYYNYAYYLNIKTMNIKDYKKILLNLKEFADVYKTQGYLSENSNLIIKDNAIDICKKFN